MTNEIIYTNLSTKPTRRTAVPTPEAPAEAPDPQVKRIRIGWGAEGRKGVAARSAEQANASADDGEQSPHEFGDRTSTRLIKARRSHHAELSRSEAPPRIEMGRVERYSKLEQIRGQRLLSETLAQRAEQSALEHLNILNSQSAQQYWIADAETGEIFLRQSFATLQHCHEAAAELEWTFDMAEVLTQRPPETMDHIEAIVLAAAWRERVALDIAAA